MTDEKKVAKYYLAGRIEDWIFNAEESDQLDVKAIPKLPGGLVGKTMVLLKETAKFEVARKADPNSAEFRKTIAEFTGEEYASYEKQGRKNWLCRLYHSFMSYFGDKIK